MQDHQRCSDNVRHLNIVDASSAVSVTTAADRRLAVSHWLLSTLDAPRRDRARMEWDKHEVALLPLGGLFSAVRIPERVVHAVARTDRPQMVAAFLAVALDEGPVIHDAASRRYYALVPATMPERWHEAAEVWRTEFGVECLGRGTHLGVPEASREALDEATRACYWAVRMPSLGVLCAPQAVARMIAAAARRLAPESGA